MELNTKEYQEFREMVEAYKKARTPDYISVPDNYERIISLLSQKDFKTWHVIWFILKQPITIVKIIYYLVKVLEFVKKLLKVKNQ